MKKIIAFLSMITLLLVMSACGSEESRTFELEEDGTYTEITYHFKGDKVSREEVHTEIDYNLINAANKEEAEASLADFTEAFQGIDGLKHDMEFLEDKVIETLDIDYGQLDFAEVEGLPGMEFDGDTENGISMKKSEE